MLSYTAMAVTEAEANAYAQSRGLDTWYYDAAALRRGQDYIAGAYNSRWSTGFTNDAAPDEVKFAIVEAAVRELAAPGSLAPDIVTGQIKKRVKVEGAVEVEYAVGDGTASEQRPTVAVIDGLLAGLVYPARGFPAIMVV